MPEKLLTPAPAVCFAEDRRSSQVSGNGKHQKDAYLTSFLTVILTLQVAWSLHSLVH